MRDRMIAAGIVLLLAGFVVASFLVPADWGDNDYPGVVVSDPDILDDLAQDLVAASPTDPPSIDLDLDLDDDGDTSADGDAATVARAYFAAKNGASAGCVLELGTISRTTVSATASYVVTGCLDPGVDETGTIEFVVRDGEFAVLDLYPDAT